MCTEKEEKMQYIYDTYGTAISFNGKYIHKLSGQAVDQLSGTQ